MSNNKTITAFIFTLFIWLSTSCSAGKTEAPTLSSILYVDNVISRSGNEIIGHNNIYIYDLENSQSSEVERNTNFSPSGWSPSGKYLLVDGFREMAGQVWISNATGKEKSKVFDIKDFLDRLPPNSIITEQPLLLNSFWMTDTLIFIKNPYGTTFLFDLNKKEIINIINGQVTCVSYSGQFWIEQESVLSPNASIVFLSGERFSIPPHVYHPSPDGKMVLYVQEQNGNRVLYAANANKQKGLFGEKAVTTLPSTASFPKWSPSSEYLLYPIPNNNESEPPFYGQCVVISATDGQEVYNERCDYGGGFIAWSPDGNLSEFGTLAYNKKFIIHNIKTKDIKTLDIFSLNLPAESTRQLVDWQMIEVP